MMSLWHCTALSVASESLLETLCFVGCRAQGLSHTLTPGWYCEHLDLCLLICHVVAPDDGRDEMQLDVVELISLV